MESHNQRGAGKALVVGGSIAGLSCAHALISAGWQVTVIEKTPSPPTGSPTGAGLGLDSQSREFLTRWISDTELLTHSTFPLSIDENRATDSEQKTSRALATDDKLDFRAAQWGELHSLICAALPRDVVLWGHQFMSFCVSDDKSTVDITVKVLQTGEVVTITGDLLVAADGSLSMIRQHYLPDFKLRYAGYSAWRGVLNFSGKEHSDTVLGIRKAYPKLGNCLYFDLAHRTHCVFYELTDKRINWIWYINMPEPELQGRSLTMKVSSDMIEKMHEEADKVWIPELAKVIKETKEPFMNLIYDSDPLPQIFWDNVVLVGDAAHPTTPHGLRSTNMSILDAGVLGRCLEQRGLDGLGLALEDFQKVRLPVIAEQVLHARHLGRVKQGMVLHDNKSFDPMMATAEESLLLQQRTMPYFGNAPIS